MPMTMSPDLLACRPRRRNVRFRDQSRIHFALIVAAAPTEITMRSRVSHPRRIEDRLSMRSKHNHDIKRPRLAAFRLFGCADA